MDGTLAFIESSFFNKNLHYSTTNEPKQHQISILVQFYFVTRRQKSIFWKALEILFCGIIRKALQIYKSNSFNNLLISNFLPAVFQSKSFQDIVFYQKKAKK